MEEEKPIYTFGGVREGLNSALVKATVNQPGLTWTSITALLGRETNLLLKLKLTRLTFSREIRN